MSRLSDAQYGLVDAYIDEKAEELCLSEQQHRTLATRVYAKDRIWDSEFWAPFADFIDDVARECGLQD